MYTFSFPGYLTIATVFLLCLVALMFLRKRIKRHITAQTNLSYKRYGLFFVIFGVIVLLASVTGYRQVQADIVASPQILQPVASITS